MYQGSANAAAVWTGLSLVVCPEEGHHCLHRASRETLHIQPLYIFCPVPSQSLTAASMGRRNVMVERFDRAGLFVSW